MPGLAGITSARGLNAEGILGLYYALDNGIPPDGVSDASAPLTALIASLPAAGGTIVLGPGTYLLNNSVVVPTSVTLMILQGVTLTGAGAFPLSGTGAIVDFRNGFTVSGAFGGTDLAPVRRIKSTAGTALTAGNFALAAGWGTTASVAVAAGSRDTRGQITVTSAGTGQAANPTITLTFADLTYGAQAPFALAQAEGGTGITAATGVGVSTTATTLVLTPILTPVAASTYTFGWVTLG